MSEFKDFEPKFDEWWEENYMNVSADRTEAFNIYSLGLKHQQAKVEELKKTNLKLEIFMLEIQQNMADANELQKRVDLVKRELKAAKEGHYGFNDEGADIDSFIFDLEQALKGEG